MYCFVDLHTTIAFSPLIYSDNELHNYYHIVVHTTLKKSVMVTDLIKLKTEMTIRVILTINHVNYHSLLFVHKAWYLQAYMCISLSIKVL